MSENPEVIEVKEEEVEVKSEKPEATEIKEDVIEAKFEPQKNKPIKSKKEKIAFWCYNF